MGGISDCPLILPAFPRPHHERGLPAVVQAPKRLWDSRPRLSVERSSKNTLTFAPNTRLILRGRGPAELSLIHVCAIKSGVH